MFCCLQVFLAHNKRGSLNILSLFQVLSLEWSSGMESLRCVGRADITLTGSFADMILFPSAGTTRTNHKADVFVLTNPGQLHFYDDDSLSALISQHQQERKQSFAAITFPAVIPTNDPAMTVAKLMKLPSGEKSLKMLSEVLLYCKAGQPHKSVIFLLISNTLSFSSCSLS